jgi:pilus assembly protein FimV
MRADSMNAQSVKTGLLCMAVTCALASMQAQAVGLGTIEVKSKLDQPFYAEIPLTLNGPDEANDLVVRLASPEAFARVGMDPNELSANLQFTIAKNARGESVVRVTTPQRLSDPYVTFLVEADWGNGKMVREYTALLDAPHTVSVPHLSINAATVQSTPLPAPVPTSSGIVPVVPEALTSASTPAAAQPTAPNETVDLAPRPTAEPMPELTAPAPIVATPQPAPQPELQSEPMPSPAESASEPAPVVEAPPPPPPAPERAAEPEAKATPGEITVARGTTLSAVAGQMRPGDVSLNRMMIALQRANPDAFIGGNINLLKSGAVLRIPDSGQAEAITAAEANALVHEQVESWRQGSQPTPQLQPEETAEALVANPSKSSAPAAVDRPAASTAKASTGKADKTQTSSGVDAITSTTHAAKPRGARLEIVPAAGNAFANSQSGASEGGSGSELRAQLAQTKEELTARNAEISDLKSKVGDLEKIQTDSQKLLSMKDSQLAAMQQRLAELEKNNAAAESAGPAPAGITASPASTSAVASTSSSSTAVQPSAATGAPAPPPSAAATTAPSKQIAAPALSKPAVQPVPPGEETPWYLQPFILAGGALIGFAALLGLMLRKRPRKIEPPPRARTFNASALAASMTAAREGAEAKRSEFAQGPADMGTPASSVVVAPSAIQTDPLHERNVAPLSKPEAPPVLAASPASPTTAVVTEATADVAADDDWAIPDPSPMRAPAQDVAATVVRPAMASANESKFSVAHKLELARAYMDVGDPDGARSMLEQVLIEGNAALQEEAFKMLDALDG